MTDGVCPFAEQVNGVTTFQSGYVDRVGFCDHTASGFYGTLRNPGYWNGAGVSVHFGISRKGEVCQITNIFDTAWAQGALGPTQSWPPFAAMGKRNPNGYLISTEHEDAETIGGKTVFVPGSQWTPEQYAADLKVKRWCIDEVRRVANLDLLRFGVDSLAGHHMFDSVNRAECPGKFWRDVYHAQLYADLVQPQEANSMANLNPDGSQKIVSDGNFVVLYNGGVPVRRWGSTDGQYPGRESKLFGNTYLWFRTLDPNGQLVAPYWSPDEGD